MIEARRTKGECEGSTHWRSTSVSQIDHPFTSRQRRNPSGPPWEWGNSAIDRDVRAGLMWTHRFTILPRLAFPCHPLRWGNTASVRLLSSWFVPRKPPFAAAPRLQSTPSLLSRLGF